MTKKTLDFELIEKLAIEWTNLCVEASNLISQYRNDDIPEGDCWPTIWKRKDAKQALLDALFLGD